MNASELKSKIEAANPGNLYFSRDAMKTFGDTMANYGVRSAKVKTNWDANDNWSESNGLIVECWELYRKKPVKHDNQSSCFWSKSDFKKVFGEKVYD